MSHNRSLRGLSLTAGLWLTASAAFAAPQSGPDMPMGPAALPPPGYVNFCERKPQDCGADSAVVIAEARRADADRAELLAQISGSRLTPPAAPAALFVSSSPNRYAPQPVSRAPAPLFPTEPARSVTVEAANFASHVDFVDPVAAHQEEQDARTPRMTPWLWSTLNRINADVNGRIEQRTDEQTYGVEDFWNTPLEDGHHAGDCEDFALEKERALIAAGVPRSALNLALVVTRWGESHAVLLVSTSEGEYVLDSLSPWVVTWREAPYLWVRRQVDGDPFHWVMVAAAANAPKRATSGFLIAFNR